MSNEASIDRLTIKMVREARDALGATLQERITWDAEAKHGCALGVVAAARARKDRKRATGSMAPSEACEILGLDEDYSYGCAAGFDGARIVDGVLQDGVFSIPYSRTKEPRFILGYTDGRAIREALLACLPTPGGCGPVPFHGVPYPCSSASAMRD
jgi:hypothetical protein